MLKPRKTALAHGRCDRASSQHPSARRSVTTSAGFAYSTASPTSVAPPSGAAASSDFLKVSHSEETRRSTVQIPGKGIENETKPTHVRQTYKQMPVKHLWKRMLAGHTPPPPPHVWGNQRQPVSKLSPHGLSSQAAAPHDQYVQKLRLDRRRHERGRNINSN